MIENFFYLGGCGLSVIPVDPRDKRPTIPTWKPFQSHIATVEEIKSWKNTPGIAIVAGKVSGNLICVDIDIKHDSQKSVNKKYFDALRSMGYEHAIKKTVIEQTPSGGYHVLFRAPFTFGCEKLARDLGKTEAMIETKGEGGYFVCAPTPGWKVLHGTLDWIPKFDEPTARAFISVARGMDRNPPPVVEIPRQKRIEKRDKKMPLDDCNERATVEEILDAAKEGGWRVTKKVGSNFHLARPEKNGRETSATLHDQKKTFYVFSTSTNMQSGKAYGPADVFIAIKHHGDIRAAVRDLISMGFGEIRNR